MMTPVDRRFRFLRIETIGYSLGYFQARRTRLCSGGDEKLAGVWNAGHKQAVHAAFLATGVPVAEATWNTVVHALDRYTTAWTAMRREACEATRLRGEQSEDLLDQRMFCLDQRLQETAATVDLFVRADRQVVERAVATTAGLPSLEACADVEALTAKLPPPRDPGVRARVEAVRAQVAGARVLTRAGKLKEAMATAQAAVTQAGPLGYGPTLAEALYQKGYDQDQTGDSQGAEETLFDAFVAAQEANHQEVAARAASQLAWTTGWVQARTAEGHRWSRLALAIAEGARVGDGVRAELFQQLAGVLANERRFAEAAEVSLRALSLHKRALGRDHIRLAPVLNNLGEIYNQLGRYQEALRYTQHGLELRKKGLEPGHPDFGRSYNALGNIYDKLDREEEAAAAFERALAIFERHYGPNHWLTAGALGNLGFTYQHLGRLERALEYDRRALASFEAGYGPEHPSVATVLAYIGDVLRLQGKPAEALPVYERAWSIEEKALASDDPDRAAVLAGMSQALSDLGRTKEAVEAGERALALLEGKPLDPKTLEQTRFILARELWDAGNRGRAVHLALQAREGLAADGHLKDQHEIESWLRQRGQTW